MPHLMRCTDCTHWFQPSPERNAITEELELLETRCPYCADAAMVREVDEMLAEDSAGDIHDGRQEGHCG